MKINRHEAEKKAEQAKRKGYSVKLTDSLLIIITPKGRTEEEVK